MSRPDTFRVGYEHLLRLEMATCGIDWKTFHTTIEYAPCPSVTVHLAGHRSWWACEFRFDGKRAKLQLFDHLFHGHYYDVVPTPPFQPMTAPSRGPGGPQGVTLSWRPSRYWLRPSVK